MDGCELAEVPLLTFPNREIPIKGQGCKAGRIVVKEDVWIGANVSIIGSVTIGKGAIIGAESVVTKEIDDFAIVACVPVKQIETR